jgi:hypothetical protein
MDTEIKTKESKFSTVFITDIGRIIFNLDYSKWPHINADIINEHINIAELDFYNIIHLAAKAVFNKKGFSHLALDLSTESSVLNYYPIDELEGSFLIDKDVARLIYLKMGDSVSATGAFTLKPPRKAFLKLVLAGYDISRPFIISGEEKPPVSGRLSGEIFIEGPLDDLKTKAALSVKEGYLGDVEYNDMIINLEGIGPLLRIHDSRIIRKDSFLTIEGTADTKRFGTSAFLEDVVISTDEKTIIWEGWDISRPVGNELKFSRDLAGGLKVGFKTQMPDERVYRPQELGRELAVEHKLSDREYEAVQFKAKDDEEFLGVIKKYKF